MSKGIFGSMFDFNGDGDLDIFEQVTEFAFLQEMMEDEEKDDSDEAYDDSDLSITLSISPGSGDDDSDDDWRDQYYGDELGLDPDDYDTEEEYREAAAEKEAWISAVPDNISALAEEYLIEPEDYDSYEDFIEAVKDELI